MTRRYTSKEQVERYTLTEIGGTFDTQLNTWIDAVSRWIELYTGRWFIADETASARLFSGTGTRELLIEDCIEITKVEQGSNYYGDSFSEIPESGSTRMYITLPANHADLEVPITKLFFRGGYWNEGIQNHRITAKWGYSEECPHPVQFAATVLVAGIINSTRKDTKEIKSEHIGNYQVTYSDQKGAKDYEQAMQGLAMYKKFYF